jgi:hypothetical protein
MDRQVPVVLSGTTVPPPNECGGLRTVSKDREESPVGSVIKKRRKRMSKKKHRKLLRRTRVQRRKLGK